MKLINKIKGKVKDYITPNNERAYNKFSESEKNELLESLNMKDNINLEKLAWEVMKLWDIDIAPSWRDIMTFKQGVVKKDSIWNYIEIDWMKCREYQPGISGLVYENSRNKYQQQQRLKIWFCEKWKFISEYYINNPYGTKNPHIPNRKRHDYAIPSAIRKLREMWL